MVNGSPASLISDEYRTQQQQLHRNPNYGVASVHFAPLVARVVRTLGASSLSDYGAGKRRLEAALREERIAVDYRPYDPAFPDYGEPCPADLVCCIDVLEHVEPDCLDAVLDDLRRITVSHGLFTVHTGPAQKVLPDGRNAHLIQRPAEWWLERLEPRFQILEARAMPLGVIVFVKGRTAEN